MSEFETSNVDFSTDLTYEDKVNNACSIAKPMAPEKLSKRLLKLTRKSRKVKKAELSLKGIVKSIEKKGITGIVLLAGDVSPVDAISHIPLICEENNIPYCYVPSKEDLGAVVGSVGPLAGVLIQSDEQYSDLYDKCHASVDALPLPI